MKKGIIRELMVDNGYIYITQWNAERTVFYSESGMYAMFFSQVNQIEYNLILN